MDHARTQHRVGPAQFSLQALFEYMTLCCVLAALCGVVGIGPSVCLMVLGLALAAGQGGLALAMLMVASLAAELPAGTGSNGAVVRQLLTMLVAMVVCGWYRLRAGHCAKSCE